MAESYKAINSNLRHLSISIKKTIPSSQLSFHQNLWTTTSLEANSKLPHYKNLHWITQRHLFCSPCLPCSIGTSFSVLLLLPLFMLFVFISLNGDSFSTAQEVFALLGISHCHISSIRLSGVSYLQNIKCSCCFCSMFHVFFLVIVAPIALSFSWELQSSFESILQIGHNTFFSFLMILCSTLQHLIGLSSY